jgi:hypothetical protein
VRHILMLPCHRGQCCICPSDDAKLHYVLITRPLCMLHSHLHFGDTGSSSEMLVPMYQTPRRCILQDCDIVFVCQDLFWGALYSRAIYFFCSSPYASRFFLFLTTHSPLSAYSIAPLSSLVPSFPPPRFVPLLQKSIAMYRTFVVVRRKIQGVAG